MRLALWFLCSLTAAVGQGVRPISPPVPSDQFKPPAPGNGTIEGTVRDKITGEPVRGALVSMGTPGGSLEASTDQAGHFAFHALPPGSYWPNAQASGYTPNRSRSAFPEPPKPVQLDQNTDKAKVELFLYPTASLSGHVFNDAGEPVGNCQVGALIQPTNNALSPRFMQVATASTDTGGEYQMHGLLRGRYVLSVRCGAVTMLPHAFMKRNDPAVPRLVYPHQFLGGADFNSAQKILVETGAHVEGIDIRLSRVRAARLEGIVHGFNSQGRGVGASLQSMEDLSWMPDEYSAPVDIQTGKFTFPNVAPGEYRLISFSGDPSSILTASQIVNIAPEKNDTVEVTLAPAPTVHGTVIQPPESETQQQQTPGRRFMIAAQPQAGQARIYFEPLEQQRFAAQTTTQVEKDGTFHMPAGLAPGRWRARVNGPNGYIKSMQVDGADVSPPDFVLSPAAAHTLRIEMGSNWGEVDVTVNSAAGSGVQDLFAVAIALGGAGDQRVYPVQQDRTAQIMQIAPGAYRVFVLPQRVAWAFAQEPRLLERFSSRGEKVVVSEGGKVQVTLSPVSAEEIAAAMDEIE